MRLDHGERQALRSVLGDDYSAASDERIDELLESVSHELSAGEWEGFRKALKQVKQALPQIATVGQQALPGVIQGATTGASVGGPWGALIGGVAGGGLSVAASQGKRKPGRRPPRGGRRPRTPRPSPRQQAAPSKAAAQFLQVMQDPAVLQSLLALVMGAAGTQQVPAGKKSVAPVQVLDLLKTFAQRASEEAPFDPGATTGDHEYAEGDAAFDPANPDERADALFRSFSEAAPKSHGLDPVEWLRDAGAAAVAGY